MFNETGISKKNRFPCSIQNLRFNMTLLFSSYMFRFIWLWYSQDFPTCWAVWLMNQEQISVTARSMDENPWIPLNQSGPSWDFSGWAWDGSVTSAGRSGLLGKEPSIGWLMLSNVEKKTYVCVEKKNIYIYTHKTCILYIDILRAYIYIYVCVYIVYV